MTRYHSFFILICVSVCSFFIISSSFEEIKMDYEKDNIVFRVTDISEKNRFITLTGENVIVNFFGEARGIYPGDIVQCNKLKKNDSYNKDYEKYLLSKGILYNLWAENVTLIEKGNNIYSLSYRVRDFLSNRIERLYGINSPLVKTLIYGERSELDKEVLDNFSKTGIIHILSLSGFHVGILILVLNLILKKVSIKKRALVIILILYFYIFVTGIRPSVVRSCSFFIIHFLSFLINKRYSLFSTACTTATLFLLFNPFLLYDKGFVMSFLGVMSIAIFNPVVRYYINEDYRDIYIVNIFITTISAQILIIPVSIYYFGIFPTISILVNIFAIPIITLIFTLSFASIAISFFSFLKIIKLINGFFVFIVILLQKILFFTIEQIANFEYSFLEISISKITMFSIYVIIGALYLFWEKKVIKENLNDAKRDNCKIT